MKLMGPYFLRLHIDYLHTWLEKKKNTFWNASLGASLGRQDDAFRTLSSLNPSIDFVGIPSQVPIHIRT